MANILDNIEWNNISDLHHAVDSHVVLFYPNASMVEAFVYKDANNNVQYTVQNEDNYIMAPTSWRFK